MAVSLRARSRLSVERLEDRTTPTAVLSENFGSFAADRVLVTLDSPAVLDAVAASPLAASARRLGGNTYLVTLNSGISVGQAVTVFSGTAGVTSAEADYDLGVQRTPNDPGFGNLWGLNNAADADIDAPEAWDTARGTGATVVAVIDTGVLYTHPDLAANMWRNTREVAGNGLDDDGNGYADDIYGYDFANGDANPLDDNGHGTHVAGTIGAVGNNGIGVSGVAWTTRIMALKFLTASGSGSTSGAVSSIYYAVDNGAKILNNSWGGGGYSQALYNAISYANSRGVIFVAAAGNETANNDTTANYPSNYAVSNVVAVAATTNTGGLASFSNYGATQVDLGAPGSGIYSTYLNNGYATLSGTSMATPHVTGALAVYWDANPGKTAAEVIQRLKATVDPLASLAGKTVTGGQLNLNRMLNGSVPPSPPAFDSGARVTAATFSGTAANTLDKVRLTFSEAINAGTFTAADVTFTGPGGAVATGVTQVNATTFDVTFAAQSAYGTYTVTVGPNILDLAGNAMNQDNDTTNGEAAADRFTGSATVAPPYRTFDYSYTASAPIRDLSTLVASLTVPTVAGVTNVPISDLNVTVNLTHTWVSDLRLTLIAPNGTRVLLFNQRGGSGDNLTNTVFNDEATTAITAGAAPFAGSFKPEQLLSAVDGLNAAGTWRLEVSDLVRGDVGTLRSFTLGFTTGTPPAGQGARAFAFVEGDADAPVELKPEPIPDTAAPSAPTFAAPTVPPDSPFTVSSPATEVPVGAPSTGMPTEARFVNPLIVTISAPLPSIAPPFEADVVELERATVVPAVEVAEPTPGTFFNADAPPANATPPASESPFSVDLLSFLSLFEKADDPFAPIRL